MPKRFILTYYGSHAVAILYFTPGSYPLVQLIVGELLHWYMVHNGIVKTIFARPKQCILVLSKSLDYYMQAKAHKFLLNTTKGWPLWHIWSGGIIVITPSVSTLLLNFRSLRNTRNFYQLLRPKLWRLSCHWTEAGLMNQSLLSTRDTLPNLSLDRTIWRTSFPACVLGVLLQECISNWSSVAS